MKVLVNSNKDIYLSLTFLAKQFSIALPWNILRVVTGRVRP